MITARRVGAFLEVRDEEGCRHLLRVNTIQAISDTDVLQNETLITAGGRTIRVHHALDEIAHMLEPGATGPREGERAEPRRPVSASCPMTRSRQ